LIAIDRSYHGLITRPESVQVGCWLCVLRNRLSIPTFSWDERARSNPEDS